MNRCTGRLRRATAGARRDRSLLAATLTLAAALAVPLAIPGGALVAQPAPASDSALAPADRRFLEDAVQTGKSVAAASRVAANRARHDEVRELASRLARDHETIATELVALADRKGYRLAVDPPASPAESPAASPPAADAEGFDREFVRRVGDEAVENAIGLFRKASTEAADFEVRSFAVRNAILLEHQHEKARLIALKLPAVGAGQPADPDPPSDRR